MTEPHLVLLDSAFYHEHMRSAVATWALLWLRKNFVGEVCPPTRSASTLACSNLLCYYLLYSTLTYSTLTYSTLLCSTLLYSTLLYSTLLYSALLCYTLLYSLLLYPALLSPTIPCPTLLYSTLPCPTLPYPTLLHTTPPYSTPGSLQQRRHGCLPPRRPPRRRRGEQESQGRDRCRTVAREQEAPQPRCRLGPLLPPPLPREDQQGLLWHPLSRRPRDVRPSRATVAASHGCAVHGQGRAVAVIGVCAS